MSSGDAEGNGWPHPGSPIQGGLLRGNLDRLLQMVFSHRGRRVRSEFDPQPQDSELPFIFRHGVADVDDILTMLATEFA